MSNCNFKEYILSVLAQNSCVVYLLTRSYADLASLRMILLSGILPCQSPELSKSIAIFGSEFLSMTADWLTDFDLMEKAKHMHTYTKHHKQPLDLLGEGSAHWAGVMINLLQVQYKNRNLYNCGVSNAKKASSLPPGSCTFVENGAGVKDELRFLRNPNEWPWEAIALIGWLVVMRLVVYIALRIKTRSKVR